MPGLYVWLNPDGLHNIDRYSSGYWLRALKYTPLPFLPIFLAGMTLGRLHCGDGCKRPFNKMWLASGAIASHNRVHLLLRGPAPAVCAAARRPDHAYFRYLWSSGLRARIGSRARWAGVRLQRSGRASLCLYLLHFNTWIVLHQFHIPGAAACAAVRPVVLIRGDADVCVRGLPPCGEAGAESFLLARYVYKTPPPVQASAPLG